MKIFKRLFLSLFILGLFFVRVDLSEGSNSFSITPFFRWGTWTPTISSAAGTWSTSNLYNNYYLRVGDLCFISLYFNGTLSVASTDYLTYTLPVAASNVGSQPIILNYTEDNSTRASGFSIIPDNGDTVLVYKNLSADQWLTTGTKYVIANYLYRCGG
jgi:hypothetical protein